MVAKGDFVYHGDHLVCPLGEVLRRSAFQQRTGTYQYVARTRDCQACPVKDTCLPPRQKRRFFSLAMHHPLILESPRTEPHCCVPMGTWPASDHRGRDFRIAGSSGMGKVPTAGAVEGGLRGLRGRTGPQREEDGA